MATAGNEATRPAPREKNEKKRRFLLVGGFDMPFLILLLLVLSVGLICMFSASFVYAYYYDGDSYFYIK